MRRALLMVVCSLLLLVSNLSAWAEEFYVIAAAHKLKNVVTVAKSGGNFTDPVAAVNSITDASASNPYLVVIAPGVYTLSELLQMKEYVDITGSGEEVTKLTGAISTYLDAASCIIRGADNSALSSLTVENTGGGTMSVAIYNFMASPKLSNVTATASGGTDSNYGIDNHYASPAMTSVSVSASGGTVDNLAVYNTSSSSPTMTNVIATASGGTHSYGVLNQDHSAPVMTNVIATATGGTTYTFGVSNSSSSPKMMNVVATATGGTNCSKAEGVDNDQSSAPTMTDMVATGSGGTHNYGVSNSNSSSPEMTNVTAKAYGALSSGIINFDTCSPVIRRSTMRGTTHGLAMGTGFSAVSQSTIIGGVSGTARCLACDNGSVILNTDCSSP